MARRRFFVDTCDGQTAHLRGEGAAHLTRVLRAEPGQEYEIAHQGRVYLARITSAAPAAVDFEVLEELPQPEPEPALALGLALFKFDRMEWMLEKATELGVSSIALIATRRVEPRLLAAAPKRLARWKAILRGAAEQSRRCDVPAISPPQPLAQFLAAPPPGRRVMLSEVSGLPALMAIPEAAILLAGPEGGFAPEEFDAAAAAGFEPVSLGPRILRTETAILAALARLRR
ncbi:MAG TPA: RsmE family RNA methyltransferase [Terriglobales bacterium]|nr:RsmE family RNA methyltransferase [Terriglobales bacterium]